MLYWLFAKQRDKIAPFPCPVPLRSRANTRNAISPTQFGFARSNKRNPHHPHLFAVIAVTGHSSVQPRKRQLQQHHYVLMNDPPVSRCGSSHRSAVLQVLLCHYCAIYQQYLLLFYSKFPEMTDCCREFSCKTLCVSGKHIPD